MPFDMKLLYFCFIVTFALALADNIPTELISQQAKFKPQMTEQENLNAHRETFLPNSIAVINNEVEAIGVQGTLGVLKGVVVTRQTISDVTVKYENYYLQTVHFSQPSKDPLQTESWKVRRYWIETDGSYKIALVILEKMVAQQGLKQ